MIREPKASSSRHSFAARHRRYGDASFTAFGGNGLGLGNTFEASADGVSSGASTIRCDVP